MLQAVNMWGLSRREQSLQALREMPGKWSEWAERVWTVRPSAGFGVRYQESCSGVSTTESSHVPWGTQEVGSRTQVELQASRPSALRAQTGVEGEGVQGCHSKHKVTVSARAHTNPPSPSLRCHLPSSFIQSQHSCDSGLSQTRFPDGPQVET